MRAAHRMSSISLLLTLGCPSAPTERCNSDADCESKEQCSGGTCIVDQVPPGRISDLAVDPFATEPNALTLVFTAPGDDGFAPTGRVARYLVSATPAGATEQAIEAEANVNAGEVERLALDGLFRGTRYTIVVTAIDDAGNETASSALDTETGGALCVDEGGVWVARGTTFTVSRPEHLVRLAGCEEIDASLVIDDTDCVLRSVAALRALRHVRALTLLGNALCGVGLTDLSELASLEVVDESLNIDSHGTLTTVELPALVSGAVALARLPRLSRLSLPTWTTGALALLENPALDDVELPLLATASYLDVRDNRAFELSLPALTEIEAATFAGPVDVELPVADVSFSLVVRAGVVRLALPNATRLTGNASFEGVLPAALDWDLENVLIEGALSFIDIDEAAFSLPPLTLSGDATLQIQRTTLASLDVTLDGAVLAIVGNGRDSDLAGPISSNALLDTVIVHGEGELQLIDNDALMLDAGDLVASSFVTYSNTLLGDVEVAASPDADIQFYNNTGVPSFTVLGSAVGAGARLSITGNEDLETVRLGDGVRLLCPSTVQAQTLEVLGTEWELECQAGDPFTPTLWGDIAVLRGIDVVTIRYAAEYGPFDALINLANTMLDLPDWERFEMDVTECFGGGVIFGNVVNPPEQTAITIDPPDCPIGVAW